MDNPNESISGPEQVATLPDAATMRDNLVAVSYPDQDRSLIAKLHPLLIKDAGTTLNATGVAIIMLKAVRDYLTEVYGAEKDMTSLEGMVIVSGKLPRYVDALIEDPAMATAVKKEIREAAFNSSALFPPKF